MKFCVLAAIAMGVFAVAPAKASVTYQTSGVFNCSDAPGLSGCNTNSIDLGTDDVVITFQGQISNTVTPTTGAPFGDVIVSCFGGTGATASCGPELLPGGITLTIFITQTSPAGGTQPLSLDATLATGTVQGSSTGATQLQFSNASTTTFGQYVYSLGPFNQPLVPPDSGSPQFGDLSLQGTITDTSSTPEPTTMALMGGGLVGLGFIARRRKQS